MTDAVATLKPQFNDPSYSIFDEAIRDESTLETRFMEIKTDPIDLTPKNNYNDFYDLTWPATPEWVNFADGYLEIQLILAGAGGNIIAGSNAAICNNIGMLFHRGQLFLGNDEIETPEYFGLADLMTKLIFVGNDWAQTVGTAEGWALDAGDGAAGTAGHAARVAFYKSGVADAAAAVPVRVLWRPPFGWLQQRKYSRNLRVMMRLYRNENKGFIHQTAGAAYTATIKSMSWWVPTIRPNPLIETELLAQLASGVPRRFQFETMRAVKFSGISHQARTINQNMANFSAKPKLVIVGFQTTPLATQTVNPAIFNPGNVRDMYLEVNERRYPYLQYATEFSATTNSYARPFMELLRVGGKLNAYDGGSQITYATWKSLYALWVFDLRNGDSGLPELNKDMCRINLNANLTADTSGSDVYMVFVFDKFVETYGADNPVIKTIYGP